MGLLKNTCFNLLAATSIVFIPVLWSEATVAQNIVNHSPSQTNEAVAPDSSISGVFDTSGGSVEVNTVKIFVNDQDVTRNSTITPNFFSYRPTQDLPPGNNRVRVEYQNTNGQQWAVGWNFQVQRPQVALEITSVTHNATNTALGAGSTFLTTINGTPGAQASVMVLDGATMRRLPAQEVSRGVYVANLNLGSTDRINDGVVVGRLERGDKTVYGAASQAVVFNPSATVTQVSQVETTTTQTTENPQNQTPQNTLTAVPSIPLSPEFTSHKNGDQIDTAGFTLKGKTQPNARVRVVVEQAASSSNILGAITTGLLNSRQLLETTVNADSNGQFTVNVPQPRLLDSGIKYSVTATAQKDGRSDTTTLSLTQR
ncbi:MAG: hypothetical protein F6K21_06915 [Symploca sp. SIO2D2]|nr:hypothetical protein [Symploca sp. SIO2D2]